MLISIVTTVLCVITLFLLGHITQAIKKIFSLITDIFLKILRLFGLKLYNKEKHFGFSVRRN